MSYFFYKNYIDFAKMNVLSKIILYVVIILLTSCIAPDGRFVVDKRGIEYSEEYVKDRQKILSEINDASDVQNDPGLAIFEGHVVNRKIIEYGQQEILIRVESVIKGDFRNDQVIVVLTPKVGNQGVQFIIGRKYKIAAMIDEKVNRLYTWEWMGTYESM